MKRSQLLHRALVGTVAALNRSRLIGHRLELLPREQLPLYAEDGLWTYHGHAFIADRRFADAYRRATIAGGTDYAIRWRVHTILWASQRALELDGAFVECGTGRGFVASAICAFHAWSDRPFYLYDTFLPTIPDEEGVQARDGVVHPYYARDASEVAANFAQWPGVQLVVGKIPDTLLDASPIAFLHVDLNNAHAEEAVVRHFWPRLTVGAPVIFDDYGFPGYERQRETAERLARELGFDILTLPTGQGLVLR
jgi:hypothetical protein